MIKAISQVGVIRSGANRRARFRRAACTLSCAFSITLAAIASHGLFAQPPSSSTPPSAVSPATAVSVPPLSNEEAQALVKRVLKTEIDSTGDSSHPMQYHLHKVSPRVATTKRIVETRDGDVARLIAVNGNPLSVEDQQKESIRLEQLLSDPSLQRHRQERERGDADRARKVIRALPDAFQYTFAGVVETLHGPSYRLTFQPNPGFDPDDLEAQVLKGMAGELWIDVAQQRVTRLEGKRIHDVDYGFGLLGKLDQGGTLVLEQADVGNHQWRTTHMVLVMNARLLFKVVKLDTTLDLSQFSPVAAGMSYQQAVQLLQEKPAAEAGR